MTFKRKDYSRQVFGWWVDNIQKRALTVIVVITLATAGILFYSIKNFKINMDIAGMISDKLHFRKVGDDFSKAFPNLSNTVVIVIDGDNVDLAVSARKRLAEGLREKTAVFKDVYEPGGGDFFEKNGLLYLSLDEFKEFADNMAAAQPFLALLSRDLSLRGLYSVLKEALKQPEGIEDKRIQSFLDSMGRAFDSAAAGSHYHMPWQEFMLGDDMVAGQRRQFIIAQPILDFSKLTAGEAPLGTIRNLAREQGLNVANGIKVRITGDIALNEENIMEVSNSIGLATALSFLLVALILYIGLWRSRRLILSSLITLTIGLIWTTGFAIAFVGSLNMISITFAVLFIGLGIDYSIQFCLRYRELMVSGSGLQKGIVITAQGVGWGLFLSCITTAIGFYSFLPTAYAGVAELGLISGTGMFISFFANMTVLPALLTLMPFKKEETWRTAGHIKKRLLATPYKKPRYIAVGALLLGMGSLALLPGVYFDYNPLNLYNQNSEALLTIKELFKDPQASPWTISILARGEDAAKGLSKRLQKLKEVKMAISIFDLVPEDQPKKLAIISDIRLFMPQPDHIAVKKLTCAENLAALNDFGTSLNDLLPSTHGAANASIKRLDKSIERLKAVLKDPSKGCGVIGAVESDMLADLPGLFDRLGTSLNASAFGMTDLPADLVSQYVSVDGRYRVQVFPGEDMMNRASLAHFANAVYTVTPDATDAPVDVYESGKAVISSFRMATLYALAAITIFLLVEMKSLFITLLILTPLGFSMLLTAASSVLLGIPLNFANVIVVPLLLGVGVHSGILFTLRYKTEPPADGNMLWTSTARAALFSFLTMMVSTGSLSFSSHRGISSIGILLTLCFGFLIAGTLVLLPALFELSKDRLK